MYAAAGMPLMAPVHTFFTSPARSHPDATHGKELPLHLVHLILTYLDHVADLARLTRTSRLLYYMTMPRLYEHVTLRAYSEIRYVDGRPEGYGSGSPFAMGLNTLVSRNFNNYIRKFRVLGNWREQDTEDYRHGRVPDSSMVLQVAMRAAIDRMTSLDSFAWELNTPPLHTIYQGLVSRPTLASLTIRCQLRRTPRPTTIIPPLLSLQTLVVYDIDPLCYPDDISLLLLGSKKLENITLHWSPRMRAEGEESVNLLSIFGRCIAAKYSLPVKRVTLYNLYSRYPSEDMYDVFSRETRTEMTIINCGGSSDPLTVFVDNSWKATPGNLYAPNLKMIRTDDTDTAMAKSLSSCKGIERVYFIASRRNDSLYSKANSCTATPTTPSHLTPSMSSGSASANGTPTHGSEVRTRNVASEYIAAIQTNHRTIRHLLLSDRWILSEDTLFRLCQSCPNLEQFGFAGSVPPLQSLRQIFALIPKLWAIRFLVRPNTDPNEKPDMMDPDTHAFALGTEFWRPEYKNVKYIGFGENLVFKLGGVYFPPNSKESSNGVEDKSVKAKLAGPIRKFEIVSRESVKHIEIWGMDTTEFDPESP
ncbi:hypothetical protein COCCADRAFT_3982 [Bipolaris zeicola 26-R-13]|uniref:F-box domain-containing protein n=1 Tax=Cochliobolus carbonum (strain 26-R-13) TaxID=930089 RepID=W6YT62_COCC2|nr:uncharacterized protein COCCADRAFT_3982 [Bipolaris zeicola 26-R-13]EUC34671.1 hypothetical protein COCCADRAFT_3982 [Bipolaris zeicola 26-R-13]